MDHIRIHDLRRIHASVAIDAWVSEGIIGASLGRRADLLTRTPDALKGIYDDLTDLILAWDRERILIELGREH